ncbi:MAG: hypothetical protein HWE18_05715 [Gammaproteobacteria bacterium]|nr:hypothetical protein [Gammaproteobacteria bacterium]
MKLLPPFLMILLTLGLTACFDSDDDDNDENSSAASQTSALSETTVNELVSYIDDSLPEYGSAPSVAYFMTDTKNTLIAAAKQLSPFPLAHAAANATNAGATTDTIDNAWDGTGNQYLISPPGGFPQANELYPGTSDPVVHVHMKDYMGYQLQNGYRREGSDGSYKPTLFGRFDSAIEISDILNELLPNGLSSGETTVYVEMVNDEPVATTSEDPDGNPVELKIIDVSGSGSLYDYAIYVESTELGIQDWLWLRNTSSELNFQQLEYKQATETIDSVETTFQRMSVTTLNWNRSSGEMKFEYVSIDDDTNTQMNASIMRLYIKETDGEAHLISFEGDGAGDNTRNEYKLFAISTEGGDAATEALVTVNFNTKDKDNNDYHIASSGFCVNMADGSKSSGCTGLNDASLDFANSFPTFVTNVIAMTQADDVLDAMGIGTWEDAANSRNGSGPEFNDATDIGAGFSAPIQ